MLRVDNPGEEFLDKETGLVIKTGTMKVPGHARDRIQAEIDKRAARAAKKEEAKEEKSRRPFAKAKEENQA